MSLGKFIKRLSGRNVDQFTDVKLRAEFKQRYNIDVGLYSYGCFDRGRIDPNTRVGRYCSISRTAFVLNRSRDLEFLTTTPYLFNATLGMVEEDLFKYEPCEIGDDVWIGHYAVVSPSVRRVGRGAVIAAGAVVTKDVPPYAVMGGVPAKVIRMRFSPAEIARIEATRWWDWDRDELARRLKETPDLLHRPAHYLAPSDAAPVPIREALP